MRPKQFRTDGLGNQPAACERNPPDASGVIFHALFPLGKIHRARERRKHHKLRKRELCLLRYSGGGGKSMRTVTGQAEDERAQNMNVMPAEFAQTVHQLLSREIEIFV